MGVSVVRGVLFIVGGLALLGGLVMISQAPELAGPGAWAIVVGGVLVVAAVLERTRYRSEAADRANDPYGPGGGEPAGTVEPRFRPTDEVFVDPTTGRRMRVLHDPRTGERRYVAEA